MDNVEKVSVDVIIAEEALSRYIQGLLILNQSLNQSFQEVINLLSNLNGKIIVSGMGKSGHVGRKFSATLSSIGVPAYFVHPSEASHGDLGMICKGDIIVLLSNSGETTELKDIVNYSKKYEIQLISLVGKAESYISRVSDICLLLPETAEASSINIPTISTTMMMILGDLIAICLLKRKNFTHEHFKTFHPGGVIGVNLLKVSDLMHKDEEIPVVTLFQDASSVLITMTSKKFGCAVVVDDTKKLQGVIDSHSLSQNMNENFFTKKANEIMNQNPVTVMEQENALKAFKMMQENNCNFLIVLKDEYVIGIIHVHDCLRAGIK